jgi:hypothetical protein
VEFQRDEPDELTLETLVRERADKEMSARHLCHGSNEENAEMKLDDDECGKLMAKRIAVGKLIDPETAEIIWRYACMFDPYNDGLDVPEKLQQVGREHFVRTPGAESWVHVGDLPETAREIILLRIHCEECDDNVLVLDL